MYLSEGFDSVLCGSFANIGKLLIDFFPDIAQLLLPIE